MNRDTTILRRVLPSKINRLVPGKEEYKHVRDKKEGTKRLDPSFRRRTIWEWKWEWENRTVFLRSLLSEYQGSLTPTHLTLTILVLGYVYRPEMAYGDIVLSIRKTVLVIEELIPSKHDQYSIKPLLLHLEKLGIK